MEKIISIELFGQTFNFQADSDPEKAQEVADLLMREVTKVEDEHKAHSQQISRLAIMLSAALNIAHDRIDMKRNENRALEDIYRRSTHLLHKLDLWVNAGDADRNQASVEK
jgi:cell division protein ZapA (FtsZ GTPase activity inhibitor)